jgi:hypothetical protein
MADSTSHPSFVLMDVVFEAVTVSFCMLLLLTVSHLTMQVGDLCARLSMHHLTLCFATQRRFKIDDRLQTSARGRMWLEELKVTACMSPCAMMPAAWFLKSRCVSTLTPCCAATPRQRLLISGA